MQAENSAVARTCTERSTKLLMGLAANHRDVADGPEEVGGLRGDEIRLAERHHLGRARVERQAPSEPGALQVRVQRLVVAATPGVAHSARTLHVALDAKRRALVNGAWAAEREHRPDGEQGLLDRHRHDRRLRHAVGGAQRVGKDRKRRPRHDRGFHTQIERELACRDPRALGPVTEGSDRRGIEDRGAVDVSDGHAGLVGVLVEVDVDGGAVGIKWCGEDARSGPDRVLSSDRGIVVVLELHEQVDGGAALLEDAPTADGRRRLDGEDCAARVRRHQLHRRRALLPEKHKDLVPHRQLRREREVGNGHVESRRPSGRAHAVAAGELDLVVEEGELKGDLSRGREAVRLHRDLRSHRALRRDFRDHHFQDRRLSIREEDTPEGSDGRAPEGDGSR
eukprot:3933045-Rhodomonas_salina.2